MHLASCSCLHAIIMKLILERNLRPRLKLKQDLMRLSPRLRLTRLSPRLRPMGLTLMRLSVWLKLRGLRLRLGHRLWYLLS